MIYLISRHAGAKDWLQQQFKGKDIEWVEQFDPSIVNSGDLVVGTLPIHLAAEVCEMGAEFWYLELNVPHEYRGYELSAEDMERFGAQLQQYHIKRV